MTTAHSAEAPRAGDAEGEALDEIAARVLWLSTAMIHHANRIRPNTSGLKVGGHQASCASMVSIMTSLWFAQLQPGDRVSVKPHASPVLHAINYLLGTLDEQYLTTLAGVRRPAELPEPLQGSRSGRLLDGIGGNRCHRAHLGSDRAALRQHRPGQYRYRTAVLVGRRCRTRRGRGVGGDPRSVGAGTRRDRLDRRHEPSVAGPGGAQHRGRPARDDVLRGGLAGHHRQIRQAAGGALRPPGRGGAAAPHPGHAEPGIPTPAALLGRRAADPAARGRRRRRRDPGTHRRTRRQHPDPGGQQPGRPRSGQPAVGVRADRRHPSDHHHRLHHQGLRPSDTRTSAEPLVAADRGAVRPTVGLPRHGSRAALEPVRRRDAGRTTLPGHRRTAAPHRTGRYRCPRGAERPRPHPAGRFDHAGRAGQGAARPDPGGTRGRQAGGDRQSRRQFHHQPRRAG